MSEPRKCLKKVIPNSPIRFHIILTAYLPAIGMKVGKEKGSMEPSPTLATVPQRAKGSAGPSVGRW